METITWDQYTSCHNIPTEWEDTSWGNDELPSYEFNGYRIWINSPDLAERKESQEHLGIKFQDWIFAVTRSSYYEDYNNLLLSSDIEEVKSFISELYHLSK